MHDLPQFLNNASVLATEWLGRLDWRTWLFLAVLLLVFPHLVREIIGLSIVVGIALCIAAFVMTALHA
jgi:hypothetical protein